MSKKNQKNSISEFIEEEAEPQEEIKIEIPKQPEFYKVPARFGSIPVDELPLGCDQKEQYKKIYPPIRLPFQPVERISFGHPDLEPNRLFFGDNLHIMRMLPSESIDLIYIDPPFFSGRTYNVVFGDQNEVRSFSDIWEGGMPGYLTWLNARLLEIKRLLKPTGSIFIHLDWHASHYVKVELDKIFGYDNFVNEIVWAYTGPRKSPKAFSRKHDVILFYCKNKDYKFEPPRIPHKSGVHNTGQVFGSFKERDEELKLELESRGKLLEDWWVDIWAADRYRAELIGYPTQKPEKLLERIILATTEKGDIVADFFCGGGTTPAVAQRLGRRWVASDISRVAVAITLDRILKVMVGGTKEKEVQYKLGRVPDISVENWGVYEVSSLTKLKQEDFRKFIILAYNGRLATGDDFVHGYKQGIPLYVGSPSQDVPIKKDNVIKFAEVITKKKGKHQGIMLGWAFAPSAWKTVETLAAQKTASIDFVKISLVPIESHEFREHITSKHREYQSLLKFILPPEIRLKITRRAPLIYEFDVSESVSLNSGSKIINVQWDFEYKDKFISTPGYLFSGFKDNKPILTTIYKFDSSGTRKIACKVQDSEGGEKILITDLEVR